MDLSAGHDDLFLPVCLTTNEEVTFLRGCALIFWLLPRSCRVADDEMGGMCPKKLGKAYAGDTLNTESKKVSLEIGGVFLRRDCCVLAELMKRKGEDQERKKNSSTQMIRVSEEIGF